MLPAAAQLTSLQSAAVKAVLESDAAISTIAQGLNLTIEGLLDLMDAPAVRTILDRILALETLRRRIGITAPLSAALRTLTALLDRQDTQPVERRRAATAILRTAASMSAPERGRPPSSERPHAAADSAPPGRAAAPSPPQPTRTPAPQSLHARAEPARTEPESSAAPASLPFVPGDRPLVAEHPFPFVPRPAPSRAAHLALAAGAAPRPP